MKKKVNNETYFANYENYLRDKMTDNQSIVDVIYEAVDEINDQLPTNRQLNKSKDEILFGSNGKLDSLDLVSLIVSIEGLVEEKFDKSITIADEKAMSLKNSPFKTIATLADYVSSLLKD